MTDTKPFWASKTFWAAIMVIAASLSGLLGIAPEQLPTADEVVAIIGGVLAIVGRFTANKRLAAS